MDLLLGNGDGTFQALTGFALDAAFLAVGGDFNGDGRLDLAAYSESGSGLAVSMLLGNGDGTFQALISTLVLPRSNATFSSIVGDYNPIVGDFNGDGRLDLLAGYHSGSSGVVGEGLLGNGDGTFQNPKSVDLGFSIQSIVTGDFNGDGKLDVALVGDADYDIMILLGIGDGTFQAPRRVETGNLPEDFTATYIGSLVAGDFNGDDHLDLAASYYDSPEGEGRLVSLGNGNGTFQAPIHSSGPFFGILAGDLTATAAMI